MYLLYFRAEECIKSKWAISGLCHYCIQGAIFVTAYAVACALCLFMKAQINSQQH